MTSDLIKCPILNLGILLLTGGGGLGVGGGGCTCDTIFSHLISVLTVNESIAMNKLQGIF